MKHTGAEIIIRMLERKGIEIVSGIPGAANLLLYHVLSDSKIKHVLARHEQGAGFIAQGMARSTGKAAVCFTTSGPGATNLLTAIADAKLDSVPIVAFTGQVASGLIGTDAFQEIDTYGLTIPITKHNFLVRSAAELLKIIPEAFRIAESGRPGPVVIDVPKDVQMQEHIFDKWPEFNLDDNQHEVDEESIVNIANALNQAEKPVILFGAGIIESGSEQDLKKLAELNNIPLISTLRGLGAINSVHPLYLGMMGMHGTKYANHLIEEADLILALGMRFDDRATGKVSEFCRNAQIIHIDIDKAEIDKIKPAYLSLHTNLKIFLETLLKHIEQNERTDWIAEVNNARNISPSGDSMPQNGDPFHPFHIIEAVSSCLPEDSIISTDVGQHQMWVAMKYPFSKPRTFLTSGGLGTMGFGVPAALGAALANPTKKVVCFSGDGSLLMNIQELATIAEEKPNLAIILFNNGYLGLVRQHQELFFNNNYVGTEFKALPDFPGIAKNFGITAFDLEKEEKPLEILEYALGLSGPVLINVPIHFKENVFPMVKPGASNKTMIG